jgi:hypothetical protein
VTALRTITRDEAIFVLSGLALIAVMLGICI